MTGHASNREIIAHLEKLGGGDLNDAGVLEDAALVLLRRYPGTRPDGLEETIANLQWIVRAIRRPAAPAPATATAKDQAR